jgi:hypothetical protein
VSFTTGLFDDEPFTDEQMVTLRSGSRTQQLTLRNQLTIDRGQHPATGLPLLSSEWGFACGDCRRAVRVKTPAGRAFWKCRRHRLGVSHSDASDIRKSWPACASFSMEATAA